MNYGKKIKKLDEYLNQFFPDQRADLFRTMVGNSTILISTSHHPDDVRAVAEHGKNVYFQVCDFGPIPDKLEKIVHAVTKFDLSGIHFFVPSERSTLKIEENLTLEPQRYIKFPTVSRTTDLDIQHEKYLKTTKK